MGSITKRNARATAGKSIRYAVTEDFTRYTSFRRFGDYLGRFIYLMDAAMDYDADKKKGSYNPFVASEKSEEEICEILQLLIGKATAVFEQMPFVQDDHLIRNILYSGVWQKYNAKFHSHRKEQADG